MCSPTRRLASTVSGRATRLHSGRAASSVPPRSFVRRITTRHIDAALLEEAGVELQGGEAFLVEVKLYHSVRWAGRYPVPRPRDGAKYFEQLWKSQGSIFNNPGAISTDMYRHACELFERMRRQLAALIDAA